MATVALVGEMAMAAVAMAAAAMAAVTTNAALWAGAGTGCPAHVPRSVERSRTFRDGGSGDPRRTQLWATSVSPVGKPFGFTCRDAPYSSSW